jgi:hypothetical protein
LEVAQHIKEIEHEADVITHQCVAALHKTFITPIERDDIHRLISRLDDIIDLTNSVAERILLYDLPVLHKDLGEMAEVLVRSCETVALAVKGLRNMKNANEVLSRCVDVNRLENEADTIFRRAMARLFKEGGSDPILIMKWRDIYAQIEAATDRCEDVANVIEGVILEHA